MEKSRKLSDFFKFFFYILDFSRLKALVAVKQKRPFCAENEGLISRNNKGENHKCLIPIWLWVSENHADSVLLELSINLFEIPAFPGSLHKKSVRCS